MKYVILAFAIFMGVYGGIFLMPYKVVTVPISIGAAATASGLLIGFLGGAWLSSSENDQFPVLLPMAAFIGIAGALGSVINLTNEISGFPMLASTGATSGVGMYLYHKYKGARNAS